MSELTAGHELDVLIAEKIMGWVRREPPEGIGELWSPPECISITLSHVPCYSTDIAAAFQAVDKLLDGTRAFVLKYGTRVFAYDIRVITLGCWRLEADNGRQRSRAS